MYDKDEVPYSVASGVCVQPPNSVSVGIGKRHGCTKYPIYDPFLFSALFFSFSPSSDALEPVQVVNTNDHSLCRRKMRDSVHIHTYSDGLDLDHLTR